MWRLDENFMELLLSYLCLGSLGIELGSSCLSRKHLRPPSHLSHLKVTALAANVPELSTWMTTSN